MFHGFVRLTQDIDITLGLDSSKLGEIKNACSSTGLEILPEKIEKFVKETNVLPALHPKTKIRVDFIFSFTPYERQAIERAVIRKIQNYPVRFASLEDLIIHKLFAGRERDFEDIKHLLSFKKKLDRRYLEGWVKEFSKLPDKGYMKKELRTLLKHS